LFLVPIQYYCLSDLWYTVAVILFANDTHPVLGLKVYFFLLLFLFIKRENQTTTANIACSSVCDALKDATSASTPVPV